MKHIILLFTLFIAISCVDKIAPTTSSIHGVVKDAETAQPLIGCAITLVPTGATTVTGQDGAYHFENVAPDTYSVEVSNYGYYANKKSVVVTAGNSMFVDVLLTKFDPNNRLPTLGAMSVSEITYNSARASSEVIDQGSTSVSERGFLYSEQPNPTIGNAIKKVVQSGAGIFSTTITALKEKTVYYVVPYAINSRGVAYGDQVKFTSGDASTITAPSNVIYVSASGNDANDGSSWSKAKKTIKEAVRVSVDGKQIWVSVGSYNEILTPKDGVNIYGGFKGSESTIDVRASKTTITMLDCDIFTKETIINGFRITNTSYLGDAVVELRDYTVLENCDITGNNNSAISIRSRSIGSIIKNCTIENNLNTNYNGVMKMSQGDMLTVINCTIRGNKGGVYCDGAIEMYNCVVTNNGKGIRTDGYLGKFVNCTIAGNESYGVSSEGKGELYNCIVWNNTISGISSGNITLSSSEYIESANNSGISFVNPSTTKGVTSDWKAANWAIQAGSTCINKGTNIYFPIADIPLDIIGNPRITGASIDIGAYEY